MFGILNDEDMKAMKEGLKKDGEFTVYGNRFKNEKDGDLYVWEDNRWVPICEALYNAEKELLEIMLDSFRLTHSKPEEDESEPDQEGEDCGIDCDNCCFKGECGVVCEDEEEDFDDDIKAMFKEIVKVTDVSVHNYDVTCTFSDGQKYTAFCHPEDRVVYSLDTGIMVCLLKRLAGGTEPLNEALNQARGVYKEKQERIEKEKKLREKKEKKAKKKAWDGTITLKFDDLIPLLRIICE